MKGVGAACLLGVTDVNARMRSGRARAALLRSVCVMMMMMMIMSRMAD